MVSNNFKKYQKYILPLAIPSRYFEWSCSIVTEQLKQAAVVLVPNTRDPFSLCKSANRTVLALAQGVPVVATPTPALEPLVDCIILDDFLGGLRLYLSDESRRQADVARGQILIETQFGQAAIATAWQAVLSGLGGMPAPEVKHDAELVVVLHLIQDLDLALPILRIAMQRGISTQVFCSAGLLKKSTRAMKLLRADGVNIRSLPEDIDSVVNIAFPISARVLLTVSETNLRPHRFSRVLTEQAQRAGLFTATLQHGFENVGLTYDDDVHAIDKIDFAADRIYLWGQLTTLHPRVPATTRAKCVPAGCTKDPYVKTGAVPLLTNRSKIVIGIFENLHWHRYSDDYRQFFLQGVLSLVNTLPEFTFVVKPHHAGMWLTARYAGSKLIADNLLIADPASPLWEMHTATSLLAHMNAVITTPSSVALDAARQGLPVAVVAHKLTLDKYLPLRSIVKEDDWVGFVRDLGNGEAAAALAAASSRYVVEAMLPGNAAERILDDLFGQNLSLTKSHA